MNRNRHSEIALSLKPLKVVKSNYGCIWMKRRGPTVYEAVVAICCLF